MTTEECKTTINDIPTDVLGLIISQNYFTSFKARLVCREWRDEIDRCGSKHFREAALKIQKFLSRNIGLSYIQCYDIIYVDRKKDFVLDTPFKRRIILRMYLQHFNPPFLKQWPSLAIRAKIYHKNSPKVLEAWKKFETLTEKQKNSRNNIILFMKAFETENLLMFGN